jgi:hypothetical protein
MICTALLPSCSCDDQLYPILDRIDEDGAPPTDEAPDDEDIDDVPGSCTEPPLLLEDLASNNDCELEPQLGTFEPVLEWEARSWPTEPASAQIMMTPAVVQLSDDDGDGDIDADDVPDIVVVSYGAGQVLRAVSGDDGHELWATINPSLEVTAGVAAGDIDGDGLVEIVTIAGGAVVAYEHTGELKWTSAFVPLDGASDNPAISDMNHDGSPEIVVGSAVLRADGSTSGIGAHGIGSTAGNVGTCSFPVDLDGDGTEELIVGNAAYRMDGTALWFNGQSDGYPAVGNFDGDADGEVVVVVGGAVRLQDTDGTVLWAQNLPGSVAFEGSYIGGPPTVADFDGDGEPEIGVATDTAYVVFEGDGTQRWQRPIQDYSSGNTGSAVFDFEGDGIAEVVFSDETRLWIFNGPDGAVKLESAEHSSYTWLEYPVVADVDGDGQAEIVVVNNAEVVGDAGRTGIGVIGDASSSWQSGRPIWNQHAYFATNINDDGTIPVTAARNWDTFNSFRSGDLSPAHGSAAPDLVMVADGTCDDLCSDGGSFRVYAHAENRGSAPSSDTNKVSVFGETADGAELLTSEVLGPLEPGAASPLLTFEVPADDAARFLTLRVEIDKPLGSALGQSVECDEGNNTATIAAPFCTEP